MDYKVFEGYNFIEEIVYVSDAETYEVVWMNDFAKKNLKSFNIGDICYKYFYNLDAPCDNCKVAGIYEKNVTKNNLLSNAKDYNFSRSITGNMYRCKKSIFEYNGKKFSIDIIYDYKDIQKSYSNNLEAMHIYEILLAKISNVQIDDTLENILRYIISAVKEVFCARRVTMIHHTQSMKFDFYSTKDADVSEFYYNPILKDIIKNDTDFVKTLENDKYLTIHAGQISKKYPKIAEVMLAEGDENITYMLWSIDSSEYKLVIENSLVNVGEKKVYKLIYNYLFFIISSIHQHNILYKLSNLDSLSGLFNRNKYNIDIKNENLENDENIGVIYLDLDNLKDINDNFGHTMGDKLILKTSKMLKECFRGSNIYRLGGDEFVIISKSIPYKNFMNQIKSLERRIKEEEIYCSYGTCYQDNNAILSEMVISAEKEMYIYKRHHHKNFFYEDERNSIIKLLTRYLANDSFYLVLQPKIDPYSSKIVGAEALIRGKEEIEWRYPNDFIPLFEKNNCIDLIDYFMLEQACSLQKKLIDEYDIIYPISVNISRSTFLLDRFEEDTKRLFLKYDLPVHSIHLEITERMDVSSEEILTHGMRLKKYGLQLEVDDFGSHFTNLRFLSKDVFSVIKLDRALLKQLRTDSITARLIDLVIDECHKRGIRALAEGIETEEDLELVKSMNIDEVQGYYFDKPMLPQDYINKYIIKKN